MSWTPSCLLVYLRPETPMVFFSRGLLSPSSAALLSWNLLGVSIFSASAPNLAKAAWQRSRKVGSWSHREQEKNITGMSLLPRKNIFARMAGRNLPEAKQQCEEPGEVISAYPQPLSYNCKRVQGSLTGSHGCPAPSPASLCLHPSSGERQTSQHLHPIKQASSLQWH